MFEDPVQHEAAVILSRPDRRGDQAGPLHSGSSNGSERKCFRQQGAPLVNFMLCYQNIFVPIKLCHYVKGDFCRWPRSNFAYVFAFCCTSGYSSDSTFEFGTEIIWKFNRYRSFKVGIAPREAMIG